MDVNETIIMIIGDNDTTMILILTIDGNPAWTQDTPIEDVIEDKDGLNDKDI